MSTTSAARMAAILTLNAVAAKFLAAQLWPPDNI
jgi:hypothetical protein